MSTLQFDDAELAALAERVAAKVAEMLAQRPAQTDAAEWLSAKQAAKHLDFTPKTLEAWRAAGRGPKWHRVGRSIRYARADLDAFARSSRRRS